MDKFWMVYMKGKRGCKGIHSIHSTRPEAEAKAEELLRLLNNSNIKVFLLESIGYAHYKPLPIKWEVIKESKCQKTK